MESNFGSSESNYGYNYGRSYGGYSSESSYPSESRDDYVSPLKINRNSFESRTPNISSESREPNFSSESREKNVSSESRGTSYEDWLKTGPWIARGGLSSPSEMHEAYEEWLQEQNGRKKVNHPAVSVTPQKQYNSLEDIDRLIERLESSLGSTQVTSERANQILAQRKQKIDELRKLVADARKAEAEENVIRQLEQDNSELDAAIDSINKGLRR